MTMISSSVGRRGRASVRHFLCEGLCGFEGTFDAVVAHERTCLLAKARRPGAPLRDPAEYACEFSCGFKGRFEETLAHEKTCPSRPDKATRFEDVSAHEKVCTSRPEADASAGAELGEAVGTVAANGSGIPVGEQNLSESTLVHMFICEFGCGFTGVFEGVQAHENECAMRPGKDLKPLAHEKICPSRPDKGTRFEDISARGKACKKTGGRCFG